jgi:hypothetical protein
MNVFVLTILASWTRICHKEKLYGDEEFGYRERRANRLSSAPNLNA